MFPITAAYDFTVIIFKTGKVLKLPIKKVNINKPYMLWPSLIWFIDLKKILDSFRRKMELCIML